MNFIHNSLWLGCTYKFRITREMFGVTTAEFKDYCSFPKTGKRTSVWAVFSKLIDEYASPRAPGFNKTPIPVSRIHPLCAHLAALS